MLKMRLLAKPPPPLATGIAKKTNQKAKKFAFLRKNFCTADGERPPGGGGVPGLAPEA
jgi:hypothetical protein